MDPETRGEISLRDIHRVVFRQRRKAALVFLTVMAAVALVTLLLPKTYRSEGKLFVRMGRENMNLDPTTTLSHLPPVVIPEFRENEINSVIEILTSRFLLEKVVDDLGPEVVLGRDRHKVPQGIALKKPSYGSLGLDAESTVFATAAGWLQGLNPNANLTERDLAIQQLSREINVTAPRKSNVISISCDTKSPELSQAIVSKVVDTYLGQHIRLNRQPGAHDFLNEQTSRISAQLIASEGQLTDLKNETGVAAVESQRELLVTRLSRLEDEFYQTDRELAASEAEVGQLANKLKSLDKTRLNATTKGSPNDASDKMRTQLYDLQLREQDLRSRFTDAHPEVIAIREQTAQAEKIFRTFSLENRSRVQETVGPSRPSEEAEVQLVYQEPKLASLRAKARVLRDQLQTVRAELKAFNRNAQRIVDLQRETDLQEAKYRKYSENLEEARIDRALENEQISNINVIEPGTYNVKPIWPKPFLNLGLGFIVALIGSVGVAVLAESTDRSSKGPGDDEPQHDMCDPASTPAAPNETSAIEGK